MNSKDLDALTKLWERRCREMEASAMSVLKQVQDEAYALGYERGVMDTRSGGMDESSNEGRARDRADPQAT